MGEKKLYAWRQADGAFGIAPYDIAYFTDGEAALGMAPEWTQASIVETAELERLREKSARCDRLTGIFVSIWGEEEFTKQLSSTPEKSG